MSSTSSTVPVGKPRTSPSLAVTSASPVSQQKTWRRGVGCQSPTHPAGISKKAHRAAGRKADRCSGGAGGAKSAVARGTATSSKCDSPAASAYRRT